MFSLKQHEKILNKRLISKVEQFKANSESKHYKPPYFDQFWLRLIVTYKNYYESMTQHDRNFLFVLKIILIQSRSFNLFFSILIPNCTLKVYTTVSLLPLNNSHTRAVFHNRFSQLTNVPMGYYQFSEYHSRIQTRQST